MPCPRHSLGYVVIGFLSEISSLQDSLWYLLVGKELNDQGRCILVLRKEYLGSLDLVSVLSILL